MWRGRQTQNEAWCGSGLKMGIHVKRLAGVQLLMGPSSPVWAFPIGASTCRLRSLTVWDVVFHIDLVRWCREGGQLGRAEPGEETGKMGKLGKWLHNIKPRPLPASVSETGHVGSGWQCRLTLSAPRPNIRPIQLPFGQLDGTLPTVEGGSWAGKPLPPGGGVPGFSEDLAGRRL